MLLAIVFLNGDKLLFVYVLKAFKCLVNLALKDLCVKFTKVSSTIKQSKF